MSALAQPNEFGCIIEGMLSDCVLAEVVQKAVETFPQDQARIERAYGIILMDGIRLITNGMWAVHSPNSTTTYIVENHYCPCPDRTNREVVCKHLYASYLFQWTERRMAHYAHLDHMDYVTGRWDQRTREDERWVWPF